MMRQFEKMQQDEARLGISCGLEKDNFLEWKVILMLPEDFPYYGGEWL